MAKQPTGDHYNDLKPVTEICDMPKGMQDYAVKVAGDALHSKRHKQTDGELADTIKRRFDSKFGGSGWHCIVGRDFGAAASYKEGSLIFFYIDKVAVMLFKAL